MFLCIGTALATEYEYQGVGVDSLTITHNNSGCVLKVDNNDIFYTDNECSEGADGSVRLYSLIAFFDFPVDSLDIRKVIKNEFSETFIEKKDVIRIGEFNYKNGYSITVSRTVPFSAYYSLLFSKEFGLIAFSRNVNNAEGPAPAWILKGRCGYGGLCRKLEPKDPTGLGPEGSP